MTTELEYLCPLLNVFDMEASLKFYTETLGFSIKQKAGPPDDVGWVMMEWNGKCLMLNTLFEKPDRPSSYDETQKHFHGDTALYFSIPNIDDYYEHLRKKGASVSAPYNTGYGFRAVDLKDPDGYSIVFHWPADDNQLQDERNGTK